MSTPSPQHSFEFFPPRDDDARADFLVARDRLARLGPAYMSVTFGAGGSTRSRTRDTVLAIHSETGVPAAPHISCMAEDHDSLHELLDSYRGAGIRRLVVLRGDRPSGGGSGVMDHAIDLVRFIRRHYGDHFHLEVACYPEHHPESPTPESDLRHFRAKVEAGANGAITQYFFNADAYFRFLDEAQRVGVDVPIVPGIMPITNYARLARFSNLCGAELPLWIAKRLQAWESDGDRESIRAFGEEVVTQLCRRLLEGGAPGLHFYTLNRAAPTLALCRNLGLGPSA
ncbi:methylenetetrahydrofolate reductase [NAD(P)H] [Wenzhouxiangella marina]|uniref:Methylenetetrahydrofolate reductase n=1 Tax=Wenzhouxiangella marina TaxID=1579979 RepID=A0A0K0XSW0_9GAMM|nr:methylenetetrahydrofolate reductase [NAD(P)H] [Wenzhouxiangella marina]AKS40773.1 Methylenetetrahydrofolate reductase [Wenzhouxiangella marina]MBB6087646.1 methylenetetrahydrofolate reductase (NADPH) [Wenzhouxiangella marina]